jgi:hypothetical protein
MVLLTLTDDIDLIDRLPITDHRGAVAGQLLPSMAGQAWTDNILLAGCHTRRMVRMFVCLQKTASYTGIGQPFVENNNDDDNENDFAHSLYPFTIAFL